MRKIFPLLMLPFLLAGCYEEILIPTVDKEPVLVMNAQMNNLEQYHFIYLSVSRLSQVDPLPGATVKVYVNGKLVADAQEIVDEDPWNRTKYYFAADFKPGDEVHIEAWDATFHATSTVIVPPSVSIESVDTSTVRLTNLDEVTDYVQVKARFRDLPGNSWYGVDQHYSDHWEFRDETVQYSFDADWFGGIETGYDPVISEGAGQVSGGDLTALFSAENYYNCFSDNPIADQECTLRVMIYPGYYYLPEYRYALYVPDWVYNEMDTWEALMNLPVRVKRTCSFRLRSLAFEQYHYLKALNNLETFGTEVNFLVEPTIIPSNVEGGLGFVGIETITELPYATFEREYGPEDTNLY